MKKTFLPLLLTAAFLFCSAVNAEQKPLPRPAPLPIEVTAQQLDASQDTHQAIFSGDVIATQGDVTLYCDRLVVFSLPDNSGVERLEASGNVRVVQSERTATADRAVYRQQDGTLVLFGNAVVHQGQNQVRGEEITVFLLENRSVVKSGDNSRVKAVLFPEKKKEEP